MWIHACYTRGDTCYTRHTWYTHVACHVAHLRHMLHLQHMLCYTCTSSYGHDTRAKDGKTRTRVLTWYTLLTQVKTVPSWWYKHMTQVNARKRKRKPEPTALIDCANCHHVSCYISRRCTKLAAPCHGSSLQRSPLLCVAPTTTSTLFQFSSNKKLAHFYEYLHGW